MAQDADSSQVPGESAARPRLRQQLREAIRRRNYSRRTEQSYWFWIRWFIRRNGLRHPAQMGATEVEVFLSWLATERKVAAATQNQALSALLFLYKELLGQDLPWFKDLVRAKRPVRVPTVLSRADVQRLLAQMQGTKWLMASLLYGAGLRQIECLHAGYDWGWQFVFPSGVLSADPDSGVIRRHHVFPDTLGRAVQELLGHSDVSATMVYTHVLNKGGRGVASPLDTLNQGGDGHAGN